MRPVEFDSVNLMPSSVGFASVDGMKRPWILIRVLLIRAGSLRIATHAGASWQLPSQLWNPLTWQAGSAQSTARLPSSSMPLLQISASGGSQSSPASTIPFSHVALALTSVGSLSKLSETTASADAEATNASLQTSSRSSQSPSCLVESTGASAAMVTTTFTVAEPAFAIVPTGHVSDVPMLDERTVHPASSLTYVISGSSRS